MRNNAAYIFNRFDKIIKRVEENEFLSNLPVKSINFCYRQENIKKRIVQRIVEICFPEFSRLCKVRENKELNLLPGMREKLNLSGVLIDLQTGNVKLTIKCIFKLLTGCLLRFVHFLPYLFYFGKKRSKITRHLESATLLFGVGDGNIFVDNDDSRFVDFCKKGPIVPLKSATNIIVQCFLPNSISSDQSVFYSKYPFHTLISSSKISFIDRIHLSIITFGGLFNFLLLSIKHPILLLVANDIPYIYAAKFLDKNDNIENIFITNTNLRSQPLWMQELSSGALQMLWYSQNIRPFVYKSDKIVSNHPVYQHLNIDESWAWTRQFADDLIKNSKKHKINCVYPILWYLQEKDLDAPNNLSDLKIGVFDITPVTKKANFKAGLCGHFYDFDTMSSFIRDIVTLKKSLEQKLSTNAEIAVKVKRNYNPGHDRLYIEELERLQKSRLITLPQNNINLFSFISGCSFIIVIPNSSPALIAEYLGIQSIYYDPTKILQPNTETGDNTWFASGYDELLATSLRVLAKKNIPG